jgi:predicted HTH transcriptional regulator
MNWQEFIAMIQTPSESTFFISNTHPIDMIGKRLSGLLNTDGGQLVIGYDKVNIHLTGYNAPDDWIDVFIQNEFNNTDLITPSFLFRSNKKILILDVSASPTPMPYQSQFYRLNQRQLSSFEPPTILSTPTIESPPLKPSVNSPVKEPMDATALVDHALNDRQIRALDHVKSTGAIKNKAYRELFGVSHKTAHLELAELVQSNHLSISGSGRSTCYIPFSDMALPTIPGPDQIQAMLNQSHQITEIMYANAFNVDLAHAIQQLDQLCHDGTLEKVLQNNDIYYVTPSK